MNVTAVLRQYGQPALMQVALAALAGGDVTPDDYVLVDNGSCAEDWAWMLEWSAQATVLHVPRNTGYVTGANLGWRLAGGDYVLLGNNDIAPARSCLRRLVAALDADPQLAWVSAAYQAGGWPWSIAAFPPDIRRELNETGGRERAAFDAWAGSLDDAPDLHYCDATEEVLYLVRRAASDQVGVFWDELYFHHNIDYGLRLKAAGWRVALCRNALVWHHEGHPTTSVDGRNDNWGPSTELMEQRWGGKWQRIAR
jgi:GT2 family glycosyltransferase